MSGLASAEARMRGQFFGLLSTVFRRPLDVRQLQMLRTEEMLAAMQAAGIRPGEGFATGDAEAVRDALAIDFTQLFHGPADHVSPYESIFFGHEGELMQGAALKVRDFMAEVGFEVVAEGGELPDHISVELAFLAELAAREADALDRKDKADAERARDIHRRFLATHLGCWAADFGKSVAARSQTGFYRTMAEALARFVADERGAEAA